MVGGVYGILQFILEPYFYHPVQFLLDYPIAFGFLGLAGIAKSDNNGVSAKSYLLVVIGVLISISGRFVAHLLSGVIFFAEYAGDLNPWVYSAAYQASYLVPEFIISSIILVLLYKPLSKIKK
jgi:thiamine transporter